MWIVITALRRPYTFLVLAVLIVLAGIYSIAKTATDIFPNIKIPITAVIWKYNGLQPEEIANRIVLFSERVAQTIVNDIEHTESQSVTGTSVVKYYFQPNAKEELAFSQITGASQTLLGFSPQGTTPPLILAYNASTVPILQLALSSDSLPESQIYDLGNNILRTALATVPGAAIPFPYGGKQRQVQVDLDLNALRARGLSGNDVVAAISAQNLVIPAGTQKIGESEYFIKLNSSPRNIEDLNNLPVKTVNGSVVYVRDVAHVRDGYTPQTNMVRLDGRRAVLMNVLKTGNASTLDIINAVNEKLPQIRAQLPPELKIEALSDQSIFVRAAIKGVVHEAIIAGALTGALILLFLGSWRSTLIITVSIPLSILASIAALSALGETINIMTLGGLALAVGILVDDATVTIENINFHLEQGKPVEQAILDGAQQIALPALVSTLAICIVFVPMFMLAGVSKFLFAPMAEAVVFAMLASYLLSRTLVPTLCKFLLKPHAPGAAHDGQGVLARFQASFERGFERTRERYKALLESALRGGPWFAGVFLAAMALSALIAFPIGPLPGLGQDFFPSVNGDQIKLHMRARSGTRIEETAALADRIEKEIRATIPAADIKNVVDNLGLPYSGINLAYSSSAPVGPADADIFINLNDGHTPVAELTHQLRKKLNADFPDVTFSFLPADIVGQILNFGLPSPLDIQISGFNVKANREFANKLLQKLRTVPGAADLRIQQENDYPQIDVDVDRSKAALLGMTEQNVASNLLVSLSGSFQTSPSFWNDPKNGTQYNVVTQTPQHQLQSLNDLGNTPLTVTNGGQQQLLSNVASVKRNASPTVVSHYNAVPTIDIYGTTEGLDLGYVSKQISQIVEESRKDLPKGSKIEVRGQVQTMHASFNGLLFGLACAILLVYLLIVVNFQSLVDPLIIISALPAALAGIVWMLFLTRTPVSVPALTGAIMCMGVATANSVLVVSFARERLNAGDSAWQAALQAGYGRLRPVMMTALAMIIGMLPMALGLGDGGEQNAPLGRAVIGGLIFATIATLFFVPVVFSVVRGRFAAPAASNLEVSHVS
ncbi:MMPL family transporter [Pseudoduganella sp. FT55W]|uniref:MMPL family transporter n=1 Tax=Duganella rivi TaxID=2666083 RepID=A0A7X4GM31_9BURK|nr:efflux RND transporter permease subunit [Duganella rivi]MYM65983.1 MMPL family transporter [Duganella rivi]